MDAPTTRRISQRFYQAIRDLQQALVYQAIRDLQQALVYPAIRDLQQALVYPAIRHLQQALVYPAIRDLQQALVYPAIRHLQQALAAMISGVATRFRFLFRRVIQWFGSLWTNRTVVQIRRGIGRRARRLPCAWILADAWQAHKQVKNIGGIDVGINPYQFLRRHMCVTVRRIDRRLRFSGAPGRRARSCLILGQTFNMLDTAETTLSHYRDQVFGTDHALPTLDLITHTRAPLMKAGGSSVAFLREAVRCAPNYAEAWLELGRRIRANGDIEGAREALRMVAISTSYADPERNLETQWFRANGVYVKALYEISQIEEELNRPDAALAAYAEAMVCQPDSHIVGAAIAELLVRRGIAVNSIGYWNAAMSARSYVPALPKEGRNLNELSLIIGSYLAHLGSEPIQAIHE